MRYQISNILTINHLMAAAELSSSRVFVFPSHNWCYYDFTMRGTLVNNHESIKETASNNDCLMQIFLGRHPPRTI